MLKKDTFQEYRQAEGLNASLLKACKSPRSVQAYFDKPSKSSDAMALGSLFHNLLLEPDSPDWAIAPEVDKRTKAGKEALAEFEATHKGKLIITQDQIETAEDMLATLEIDGWVLHPFAEVETSCYHEGKKARFDAFLPPCDEFPSGIIWDIKTAKASDFKGFQRSCYDFGYSLQAAWYCHLFELEFGVIPEFRFLAIETTSPHMWNEFTCDGDFIADGWKRVEKAFEVYNRFKAGSRKANEDRALQLLTPAPWWGE